MIRTRAGGFALLLAWVCCSSALAQTLGTDVIVGDLPSTSNNSPTTINGVDYDSVAVGTTSCNKGTAVLAWTTGGTDNRHPAISQNLFRLRNGQFEQLGQGWLKHGFTALQGNVCTTQFGYPCTPFPSGAALGVGCSDPYSSGLNNVSGGSNLGPKWQVNAATGLFPYPWTSATWPAGSPAANIGPPRVRLSELNTHVAGDRYFMDAQYVAGDDGAASSGGFPNKGNNASWVEVSLASTGTPPAATNFTLSTTGSTTRELPAVYAWASIDSSVSITTYDVPGDGRFILACKVSGSGPYTYEYALYNLNSHRCAGSFTVPLPASHPALTGVGFHDCEIVGEPNALADPNNPAADDWSVSGAGANSPTISWTGPAHSGSEPVYISDSSFRVTSFTPGTGNDHTANVLRWATMFNFRFTSSLAPATGTVAVGLWRSGTAPPTAYMTVRTPGGSIVSGSAVTASCCLGTACSVTSQAGCGAGVWGAPGSTCVPTDPCDTGSCCHTVGTNGNCTITPSYGCNTGTFTQNGACNPNPCPSTPGTCCNGTTCTFVGQSSCTGTWSNGSCTGNPCDPSGACCTGISCAFVAQSACSGAFTSGLSCSGNPCDPSGACCVDGACSITVRSACTGSHTAGLTSCTGFICASGNDACGGAIALCDATPVTSTTVGATVTSADGTASCGSSSSTPDVWYSYIPASSGAIVVDTCGAATNFDTVLSVHTGLCGALTQTACNDDSTTSPCTANRSRISFTGAAGTRYLVRVSGWNGNTGTFTLTVTGGGGQGCNPTGACCNGFACSTVAQAACTSPSVWDGGACAVNPCDPTGACCSGFTCLGVTQSSCTGPAVWIGGSCTANLCDPIGSCCDDSLCNVVAQSACNLTFALGGTCTTNPCNPSGRCCSGGGCNITLQHGCVGVFTVGIASCTPNTCPPLSDDCENRAGIPIGATPFDTTNATTDGPPHALCLGSGDSQIGKDVWFNHPSQFTGTLDIDTCGSTFDTKLAVYLGYGCADLESRLMACNDDSNCASGTLQSKLTINVVCGEHYTIRVGGYTNGSGVTASGAGTLNLTAHPVPTGACCDASGGCTLTYQSCCTTIWNGAASCNIKPDPCVLPGIAICCTNGACTVIFDANDNAACITGGGQSLKTPNPSWTPKPRPAPIGVCCRGATCSTAYTTAAACAAAYTSTTPAVTKFVASASACNVPVSTPGMLGNTTNPCCYANYNHNATLEVQDIFDFLNDWFAGNKAARTGGDGDTGTLQVQNIFDFLNAWFAGGCV